MCDHRGKTIIKGGGIYGLAFVGALIYYLQHTESFWGGVLGILKALVWPALLIYKLFDFVDTHGLCPWH